MSQLTPEEEQRINEAKSLIARGNEQILDSQQTISRTDLKLKELETEMQIIEKAIAMRRAVLAGQAAKMPTFTESDVSFINDKLPTIEGDMFVAELQPVVEPVAPASPNHVASATPKSTHSGSNAGNMTPKSVASSHHTPNSATHQPATTQQPATSQQPASARSHSSHHSSAASSSSVSSSASSSQPAGRAPAIDEGQPATPASDRQQQTQQADNDDSASVSSSEVSSSAVSSEE